MSGAELTIALNVEPHTPSSLMAACVRDANEAFETGQQTYIRNVLRLAQFVAGAEKYAKKAGISFRSLFRDDGDSGQHVAHPLFVFSRAKGKMLLAIAKNPALVGGQHVDHLPDDYNTLSRLAQIPAGKLTKLIESGKVTNTTNRREVELLVTTATSRARKQPPAQTANPAKSPLPEVAAPLPIASPRASYAVEIPDEGKKAAEAPASDREADLARCKAAITAYAKLYGWGAAQMDLMPWIEAQA